MLKKEFIEKYMPLPSVEAMEHCTQREVNTLHDDYYKLTEADLNSVIQDELEKFVLYNYPDESTGLTDYDKKFIQSYLNSNK